MTNTELEGSLPNEADMDLNHPDIARSKEKMAGDIIPIIDMCIEANMVRPVTANDGGQVLGVLLHNARDEGDGYLYFLSHDGSMAAKIGGRGAQLREAGHANPDLDPYEVRADSPREAVTGIAESIGTSGLTTNGKILTNEQKLRVATTAANSMNDIKIEAEKLLSGI